MTCTIPGGLQGTITACRAEAWLKKESALVDSLHKAIEDAVTAACRLVDPPPPPGPIVEFLCTLVDAAQVIEHYYYKVVNDPLGVALEPERWQTVLKAFSWTVVKSFYDAEDWENRG